ncbi:Exosome complex exonuclease RRP42 [Perkinsela sp. CCAP 1560/4]|nr:Exosome complex exonuclease RRP42 [Perkinsela sp. CCAP 1560/4]|eukprot:KNH06659.1 Exosome complex exonuclease RRP42 [Perkinsela sp. CCAP 1560/4]
MLRRRIPDTKIYSRLFSHYRHSMNVSDGEFAHVEGGIEQNVRLDGRSRTEVRGISIQTGIIKAAYGSSHVLLGPEQGEGNRTEVLAAVYGHVHPADEGSYWFHVDPTPLTASQYGPIDNIDCTKESFASKLETQLTAIYGASRPLSKVTHPEAASIFLDNHFQKAGETCSNVEISPVSPVPVLPLDYPVGSKTSIDRSSLNIAEGLSWGIKIEVLVIGGSGGNIILAATNAVNAALRDTTLPEVEMGMEGSSEIKLLPERETRIQNTERLPLASLVLSTGNFFLIDPSSIEEQIPHSKGYIVAIEPCGRIVHFASVALARNSSTVSVPNMLCILREAPVLLKVIHEMFSQALA